MAIPSRYQRCGKPQTYNEAVMKFVTLSTIRGMKRVTMSVNWLWSGVWIAAILSLTAVIIYQLARHIHAYYRYDLIQAHIEQTDYLINYPSVTICPLQPFNSKFAQRDTRYDKHYLDGDLHILEYIERLEEKKRKGDISEDMLTLDTEGLASIIGYYQNIKRANVRKFGHSQDSLIVDCQIEQTNSSSGMKKYSACANITRIYSAQYFNCYRVVIPSSLESSVSNLGMIIYLDDFGTVHYPAILSRDFQAQKYGVKVVIHEDDTWPDLSGGDEIAPGIAATFHITEKEYTLSGPPWGNCSRVLTLENDKPIEDKRLVDETGFPYKYTKDLCRKFIAQRNVITNCGCKLALLPIPELDPLKQNDGENYTFCDDIDISADKLRASMLCVQKQLKDFRDLDFDDELDQQCPLPCYDQDYAYIKALSQWPHDSYHLAFYETFIKNKTFAHRFKLYEEIAQFSETDYKTAYDKLLESDLIERNFIKLSFKMKYKFDVIRQEPKMSQAQLLANVGGTLSLWLGISVIALIEVFELLVDLCRIYKRRNFGGLNTLQVTAEQTNSSKPVTTTTTDTYSGQYRFRQSATFASFNGTTNLDNSNFRERYSAFSEDCWF